LLDIAVFFDLDVPYTCGSADNDGEYEVEEILNACINCRRPQYRVGWLRYEDDLEWYDAFNFKNSPYKLCDVHATNVVLPGPQKGWASGYSVAREMEMRMTIQMTTSRRDTQEQR
jgi:hypothetical protein